MPVKPSRLHQAHDGERTLARPFTDPTQEVERVATFYSLIGTAKLNGLDPQAYLAHVLERIGEHRVDRVAELLPWNVANLLARSGVEALRAA